MPDGSHEGAHGHGGKGVGRYVDSFFDTVFRMLDGPVVWVHDKIVAPNQKKYPWYHQQFRRVPTIDQCYTDDPVCEFEANHQFKRDKLVESEILNILRQRYEDCVMYEMPDVAPCKKLWFIYKDAETNWFIKYGDLGGYASAKRCYFKQKHRLIWERRHGPVGTGMKET